MTTGSAPVASAPVGKPVGGAAPRSGPIDPTGVGGGRLHHFLAFGALAFILLKILHGQVKPVAETSPVLAALVSVLVVGPALVNLARIERARLGCAAPPLGLALWSLDTLVGRPALEGLLLLAAPNLLFLVWDLGLGPLRAQLEARSALRLLDETQDPLVLAAHLGHESQDVRRRAAARLGSRPTAEAMPLVRDALGSQDAGERHGARLALRALAMQLDGFGPTQDLLRARVRDAAPPLAAEAAYELAALDAQGDLVASLAPGDERPQVRLAYAEGLLAATAASDGSGSRASLAATLLISVLGDPRVDDAVRAKALEVVDHCPPREARAAACPLLVRGEVTAEVLWILVDHGQPEDAPLAARWAGAEQFDQAHAAIEAVGSILDRAGEPGLGVHAAPTRAALEQARARLRAVHPEKDNPLADDLVARLDELVSDLTPTT